MPGHLPGERNPFEETPGGNPPSTNPTPPQNGETPSNQRPGETDHGATTKAPNFTPAQQEIATARDLIKQEKYDEAITHLNAAIKLKPEDKDLADAYFQLGNLYRLLNRYDDAIDAYTTSIQLNPDQPETYFRRGIVWFYKGEYGVAWDDFDDASAILYDDPRPELWKGLSLARQKNWLDAVNTYAVSIRNDARFTPAYVNRGLAYLMLNEPEKAIGDFDQAVRLDPHNAANYFKRGVALGRAGKWRLAIDSYSEALRLNPKYAEALYNRSLAYQQIGETDKARADREQRRETESRNRQATN